MSLLAEVALDRAKAMGVKLVRERLVEPCGRLELDGRPLLPQTCAALESIRLEDLASTGRQLADAALGDLVNLAVVQVADLAGGGAFRGEALTMHRRLRRQGGPGGRPRDCGADSGDVSIPGA